MLVDGWNLVVQSIVLSLEGSSACRLVRMREHQVTIFLNLQHRCFRTPKALYSLHELARRLADAVLRHATGRFSGHETSGTQLKMTFHGPNADRLFNTIRGPLFASYRSSGGHAIKRYGPSGLGHKEVRLDFDAEQRRKAARSIKRRLKKEQ